MRQRVLKTVHYARLDKLVREIDGDGNYTGEYSAIYSDPIKKKMNISVPRENAYLTPYGISIPYDVTLVIKETDLGITETSVFWIDSDVSEQPDYNVIRVSETLMYTKIYLSKKQLNNTELE